MKQRMPDQAEKLRQLVANESSATAVLEEPSATAVLEPPQAGGSAVEEKPSIPLESIADSRKDNSETGFVPGIKTGSNPPANGKTNGKKKLKRNRLRKNKEKAQALQAKAEPVHPKKEEDAPKSESKPENKPDQPVEGKIEIHEKTVITGQNKPGMEESEKSNRAGKPERKVVTPLLDSHRFPMNQTTQVIAITGGKGGVGKSNLACNMAIAMAQMNKRVLVLDADLSLANVDVLLGLTPRFNLSHVLNGDKVLKDIMIEGPEGIRIIPGGSGVEELSQLNPAKMTRLFEAFSGIFPVPDVFLIDTAAGIHPNVMQFLSAADKVIVVTTPEPTAYTDAYALIKTLLKHQDGKEIGLLVNMAQNAREAAEVLRLLLQMCRQFLNLSFNNVGFVPRDPEVLKAVRYQKPFLIRTPNSPASKTIRNIAATILQIETKNKQPGGLKRFFKKLFKTDTEKAAAS